MVRGIMIVDLVQFTSRFRVFSEVLLTAYVISVV